MEQVKTNRIYQHFKGNFYYVVDVALDSETKERMVVYKPLYPRNDSEFWVRREKMFLEEIPERPDNVTGQTVRFKLIDKLSVNYVESDEKLVI